MNPSDKDPNAGGVHEPPAGCHDPDDKPAQSHKSHREKNLLGSSVGSIRIVDVL